MTRDRTHGDWNLVGHGDIRVIELESRKTAFIQEQKVAGVVELKEGGPARLLFNGGGHIDVCGSAEEFRLLLRLAQLGVSA